MEDLKPTEGEQRVRVDFNPSSSGDVYEIKSKVAELINLMNDLKQKGANVREAATAQTKLEEAAMWAVKAATSI